jgi:hypothetical protein
MANELEKALAANRKVTLHTRGGYSTSAKVEGVNGPWVRLRIGKKTVIVRTDSIDVVESK